MDRGRGGRCPTGADRFCGRGTVALDGTLLYWNTAGHRDGKGRSSRPEERFTRPAVGGVRREKDGRRLPFGGTAGRRSAIGLPGAPSAESQCIPRPIL